MCPGLSPPSDRLCVHGAVPALPVGREKHVLWQTGPMGTGVQQGGVPRGKWAGSWGGWGQAGGRARASPQLTTGGARETGIGLEGSISFTQKRGSSQRCQAKGGRPGETGKERPYLDGQPPTAPAAPATPGSHSRGPGSLGSRTLWPGPHAGSTCPMRRTHRLLTLSTARILAQMKTRRGRSSRAELCSSFST